MNDPLNVVERLATQARKHSPTPMSVADDVLRELRRPERTLLAWLTAAAVAAAILVTLFGGVAGGDMDSLDVLFQTADVIHLEGGF